MINEESLKILAASTLGERLMRPVYDTYGFAHLPATLQYLLTGQADSATLPAAALGGEPRTFSKVIFILLDGFGWNFVERNLPRYPFLRRFLEQGVVSKLSSQFPSTTTAHITTLRTGQPVGEHGLYEWFIYEPSLGEVIIPLMFSRAVNGGPESLAQSGVDPETIYPPGKNFYQGLGRKVTSYILEPAAIAGSTYNRFTTKGARVMPYKTLPEALVNVGKLAATPQERALISLYYDGIDTLCHRYGPDSPHVRAEVDMVLTALENTLQPALEGLGDVALILTADHNHTALIPENTVYLGEALPHLAPYLALDAQGTLLPPAGSPRDCFLHVRPEYVDTVWAELGEYLRGRAEVFRTADLVRDGFFGPVISERLLSRLASVVVLPYQGQSVWWEGGDGPQTRLRGCHGGLCRDEAETVFLFQAS